MEKTWKCSRTFTSPKNNISWRFGSNDYPFQTGDGLSFHVTHLKIKMTLENHLLSSRKYIFKWLVFYSHLGFPVL